MAKITTVREARGAIPNNPITYMVRDGDTLILSRGGETSILRGAIAKWVEAHMLRTGDVSGSLTTTPTGAVIKGDDFEAHLEGWPPRSSPPTSTPPPASEQPAPAATVPTPDVPRAPETVEDWRHAIANATAEPIPEIGAAAPGETLAEYSTRVLAPLGLVVAQLGHHPSVLERIVNQEHDASWNAFLEAAGVRRMEASNPGPLNDTGVRLKAPDGTEIQVIAHEGEKKEDAVARVAANHPGATAS